MVEKAHLNPSNPVPNAGIRNIICVGVTLLMTVSCVILAVCAPFTFAAAAAALQLSTSMFSTVLLGVSTAVIMSMTINSFIFFLWGQFSKSPEPVKAELHHVPNQPELPEVNLNKNDPSEPPQVPDQHKFQRTTLNECGQIKSPQVPNQSKFMDPTMNVFSEIEAILTGITAYSSAVDTAINNLEKLHHSTFTDDEKCVIGDILTKFNIGLTNIETIEITDKKVFINGSQIETAEFITENVFKVLLKECNNLRTFHCKSNNWHFKIDCFPSGIGTIDINSTSLEIDANVFKDLADLHALAIQNVKVNGEITELPSELAHIVFRGNFTFNKGLFSNINGLERLIITDTQVSDCATIDSLPTQIRCFMIDAPVKFSATAINKLKDLCSLYLSKKVSVHGGNLEISPNCNKENCHAQMCSNANIQEG
ncbi:MAG: hypothetical protein LBI69_00635 [Puniceicoccales bacterium]|jgi:hypothetical protein|nr:hypothetical protein [Puniceicoccales bacterium]